MRRSITTAVLMIILITSSFAQASTECKDDKRLSDKRALIKIVRSGEAIVPKLTVSFESFLNMHPKMKSIISGGDGNPNFNIVNQDCKIMDLSNTSSSQKHQMPFKELKSNLIKLQNKGKASNLELFIDNVQVAPMPTVDILRLLTYDRVKILNRKTICALQNHGRLKLGMSDFALNSQNVNLRGYKRNDCDNPESMVVAPDQIDLYAGFGGKFLEKEVVIDSGYARNYTDGYPNTNKANYHYLQATFIDSETGKTSSTWFYNKVNKDQFHIARNQHILNIVAPHMNAEINTTTFDWYNYRTNTDFSRYMLQAKTRHNAIKDKANSPSLHGQKSKCKDDERLNNLQNLIAEVQIGKEISPLIKMSYFKYLNMDQDSKSIIEGGVDALNLDLFDDNCNSIMLMDGESIDNIGMSFNNIYKTILGFQEKGDLDSIADLYKSVNANPESIEKVMDWVLNINPEIFETPTTCYLQELGAIRSGLAMYDRTTPMANKCDGISTANQPSKIDLFAGFGGTIRDKEVKLSLSSTGKTTNEYYSPGSSSNTANHTFDFILQGDYLDENDILKPIMKTASFGNEKRRSQTKANHGNYAIKDNLMALDIRSTELNIDFKLIGWINAESPGKYPTKGHDARVVEYKKKLSIRADAIKSAKNDSVNGSNLENEGGYLEAQEME